MVMQSANQTRNTTNSGDINFIAAGSPLSLPAGNLSTTLKVGGSTASSDSTVRNLGLSSASHIARSEGDVSLNVDVPLSSDANPLIPGLNIGKLSANGNAALHQLSDFGTLRTLGGGITWNPVKAFSLIAAYRRPERPSATQYGGAILSTANYQIFDYSTGQSARVLATTGGNPVCAMPGCAISGWAPRCAWPSPTSRSTSTITAPGRPTRSSACPAPPGGAGGLSRTLRDAAGTLTSVDLRPINIASEDRSQLRWG
jgi:hypothetical protein